jgi:hypothetical protein
MDRLRKIKALAKVGIELCGKHRCHDVLYFLKEIEKLSQEETAEKCNGINA